MPSTDDWKNIDLDEGLSLDESEFTEASEVAIEADPDKPKKKKPKRSSSGPGLKERVLGFLGTMAGKITAGVLALLIVVGLIFTLINGGSKSSSGGNSGGNSASQTNTSQAKVSGGLEKKTYQLFTAAIKDAINGNETKTKVGERWRAATVNYKDTNDLEAFKADLLEINETRKAALEAIPNDGQPVNTNMIDVLNNQLNYLNRSFEVTNSEDAILIYNEWVQDDKVRNNTYIEVLITELEKVGIPYTTSTSDDGVVSLVY